MAIGIMCGLFYVLSSLYTGTTILRPLSTITLYTGITALVVGLVLYGLAREKQSPSGKKS
jgi:hypothetical protein